jgi:tRNA A-37 threonylcarbamoyl transferase component Bud32
MKPTDGGAIRWVLVDEALAGPLASVRPDDAARRDHLFITARDGEVFVKAFRERGLEGFLRNRLAPRGKVEFELGRRLIELGVPTPEPLGYGIGKNHSFVVQRRLSGEPLSGLLTRQEERLPRLRDLARFLNLLKTCGVRHNDLHLENIVAAEGDLYLIDLHSARIKDAFTAADELSNLSHALAMHYRTMDDGEKRAFFEAYGSDALRRDLEDRIAAMEERWVRSKAKRALGATSQIVLQGPYVCLAGMMPPPDEGAAHVLKEDRKVKVERFGTFLRKTYGSRRRILKAWRAHVTLHYMGLSATPQAYWMKKPTLGTRGFIAMEDLGGKGRELDRFLDGRYGTMDFAERRELVRGLAAFFRRLFARRVTHRDLKACNVFVLSTGEYRLLDVEDIVFAEAADDYYVRMLVQLNMTVPRRIAVRDRLRFLALLVDGDRQRRKAILKEVARQSLGQPIVYEGVSGLVVESW